MIRKLILLSIILCSCSILSYANNPGGHMVQLTWNDPCSNCTFNIYRGASPGVCGLGKTPFAQNIITLAYEDDSVLPGQSYVYAVTAMPALGGESTCSAEVQLSVSNSQAQATTVPSGQSH